MSDDAETRDDRYADVDTSHLEDVEDGCGCTEIWEHTSDRAAGTEDDNDDPTEDVAEAESSD
ncbi:hypothetical protein [Halorarius litoreus]|uniref:hypothetical protein n=1 Tax=Halorarius litoreus TaxID=2962676 RepID=UPI0020CC8D79|nr:hypothetical protein [Halorarius litoreus]